MQVAVQLQLEQIARIVPRTPRFRRLGAHEPKLVHLQLADERLDHPTQVIGWNQIIQR